MDFKFFRGESSVSVNYDRHNVVWRTATGRHTPIFFMTNSHIINTLGCLRGVGLTEIPDPYFGRTKQEWIDILTRELRIRQEENSN